RPDGVLRLEEELLGEIRSSPFAIGRRAIDPKQEAPGVEIDPITPYPLDLDAGLLDAPALLLDLLSDLRAERAQEVVERRVARVAPMELVGGPPREALPFEEGRLFVEREQ